MADFGFSTLLNGKDGSGMLSTYLGTRAYMAPEIIKKVPYSGIAVDVFALGVILFIMYAGSPPFNEAQSTDAYYNLLITKRYDYFWYVHTKSKGDPKFFTPAFKDLINRMLAYDATERPTVTEIAEHAWMKGTMPSEVDVQAQMVQRAHVVREKQEEERRKKQEAAKQKKRKTQLHAILA